MDVVARSRCAPHITTDQVPSVDQQTSPPLKGAHASGLPSAAHVLERLAGWMPGDLVLYDKIDPPLGNESDHLRIRQEPQ